MRRVVTGHDPTGKSVIAMDGQTVRVNDFRTFPGLRFEEVWATDAGASLPVLEGDPTTGLSRFVPLPDGTRFRICHFPPDARLGELLQSGHATLEQLGGEFVAAMPDLASTIEPEHPGMHTTDTIDYNIVLSGEIWCELDDGAGVKLSAGDVLVQCGTRHAWRNTGTEDCIIASVMVGASRKSRP